MARERRLALTWHIAEAVLVTGLAALSVVGLVWSWKHRRTPMHDIPVRP